MKFQIISLFPEYFSGPLSCGLMQKATVSGLVSFSFHNPRDFTADKHKTVDDRPYGGGPGMVMMPEPLRQCLTSLGFAEKHPNVQTNHQAAMHDSGVAFPLDGTPCALEGQPASARSGTASVAPVNQPPSGQEIAEKIFVQSDGKEYGQPIGEEASGQLVDQKTTSKLIYLSPRGKPFTQDLAKKLAQEPSLTLLCGRYEGIDARIEELFPVESISVGDFVLNGGEAGAICLIEAVARLLPGFMGHEDSGEDESFSHGLLEYPHYTRPESFCQVSVPKILTQGNHAAIAAWRRQKMLQETLYRRPEMLSSAPLTAEDRFFVKEQPLWRPGKNLYCGLVHYPVLDKEKNSVAVSLTNLDVHDIARSSCTYGLGGYYVITPLEDQQRILAEILGHWTNGPGSRSNEDRKRALSLVTGVQDVAAAIKEIESTTGQSPLLIGTSALLAPSGRKKKKTQPAQEISFSSLREKLAEKPVLLLFGTGHGLAPEISERCDAFLPPVRWHGSYNHLSVRSAVAIILDRTLGDWY